jgi:hypothetical protein
VNIPSLCKIWGFHGDDYAAIHLLGSCAVYNWLEPTFRRNVSPPPPPRTVTSLLRISRVFSLTLKMEATRSSETSVLTNYTRHKIPEDGLLHTIITLQCFRKSMILLLHCFWPIHVPFLVHSKPSWAPTKFALLIHHSGASNTLKTLSDFQFDQHNQPLMS